MATIQDVAKLAGVSVATVSRVLNNSSSVIDITKEKVLKAISTLNYQPNLLGRNLRRSETKVILVMLPSIANPFYSKIVKGIEEVGHENGFNIMLCNTNSDISREDAYLEMLKNRLADGIIIMATQQSGTALSLLGKSYPVVQCSEYNEGSNISHVLIDNFMAAYEAVMYLAQKGHSRIALISCKNDIYSTIQREKGYKKALIDAGIPYDKDLIFYGDYGFNSGIRCAREMFSMSNRPTAAFSISDSMAIGVIKVAKELNIKTPQEFAIIGFDNISFALMCDPPLSTIAQPMYELGRSAMELLLKQISGEVAECTDIFLGHNMLLRETT